MNIARGSRTLATYYLVAGVAIAVFAAVTRGWEMLVVGVPLAAMGAAGLGSGESASWLRGDLDERRQGAVDHGFRVAFLVLAWWVAALTLVSGLRDVPIGLWSGGIVVALAAASVDYALVLRRT